MGGAQSQSDSSVPSEPLRGSWRNEISGEQRGGSCSPHVPLCPLHPARAASSRGL